MSNTSSHADFAAASIQIRPYMPEDREFLLSLAPRLTIGIAPWRSSEVMEAAMRQFILESIEQNPTQTTISVAINQQGHQLGFASISHAKNFTGEPQSYLGELAIREDVEGHGVGDVLVEAC